jgi:hypothetical protein
VPAAAVIPALIAYIKVVAVKTFVVEILLPVVGWPYGFILIVGSINLTIWQRIFRVVTVRKLECFKQACALNTPAWNNK